MIKLSLKMIKKKKKKEILWQIFKRNGFFKSRLQITEIEQKNEGSLFLANLEVSLTIFIQKQLVES